MKASEKMTPMRIDALVDAIMSKKIPKWKEYGLLVEYDATQNKFENKCLSFLARFRVSSETKNSKMSFFFGAFLAVCHLSQEVALPLLDTDCLYVRYKYYSS
jgi:hypothetical protein